MNRRILIFVLAAWLCGCAGKAKQELRFHSGHIGQVLNKMTDLMIQDVTNPPLAARFFSYACLAGYEVLAQHDPAYPSMEGKLNQFPHIGKPDTISGHHPQLSALLAMMETARKLQPSGALMEKYQQAFLDSCRRQGLPEELIAPSLAYARVISKQVLAYAKADKYNRTSNYPRYTPSQEEGAWYPTPPAFFAPVEPYFNTVRSFTLDTCTQFKPVPPVAFSKDKNSAFYKLLEACYRQGNNLSKEQRAIAAFWDCNPFALQSRGHLMTGMKKISPGAHWLGITSIACQKTKTDFPKAMKIHTTVSLALMDGFLACWDEKFRSNRIRPETAIRRYIDPDWKPLLQTPPFPEYLSGHSTISAAAATVLTHYFGDNFAYTDTVEERFQLPARKFTSFQQAAIEAGISRFYGGIHFMDAIDQGRLQGLQVGDWVLQKVEGKGAGLVAHTP
ncbi:MAG: vanadium-dependent haloperoxidase [Adhaeribacter sp.]